MNNKVALIIDGSDGIRKATTSLLTEKGVKVYATYHLNKGNLEKIEKLEEYEIIACDIRDEKNIREIVDFIINKDSKIDIVINTVTNRLKLKTFDKLSYLEFF